MSHRRSLSMFLVRRELQTIMLSSMILSTFPKFFRRSTQNMYLSS